MTAAHPLVPGMSLPKEAFPWPPLEVEPLPLHTCLGHHGIPPGALTTICKYILSLVSI